MNIKDININKIVENVCGIYIMAPSSYIPYTYIYYSIEDDSIYVSDVFPKSTRDKIISKISYDDVYKEENNQLPIKIAKSINDFISEYRNDKIDSILNI